VISSHPQSWHRGEEVPTCRLAAELLPVLKRRFAAVVSLNQTKQRNQPNQQATKKPQSASFHTFLLPCRRPACCAKDAEAQRQQHTCIPPGFRARRSRCAKRTRKIRRLAQSCGFPSHHTQTPSRTQPACSCSSKPDLVWVGLGSGCCSPPRDTPECSSSVTHVKW